MPADAQLVLDVDHRTSSTQRWDLGGSTIIGRSADADICVNLDAVSRQHARIDQQPNGFWLTDLGSRNGTFHEEVRISEPVRLLDGDRIVLGGAVSLRFVDLLATPMAPAIGRLHGLWIDPESRAVWIDARRVEPPLSERQLSLLELLHDAAGEIVSRSGAVDHVWSDVAAEGVSDDALAALIKRLKARLKPFESGAPHVEIVKSRGLRLHNP